MISSESEADIQIQVVEYLSLLAAQCGFLIFAVSNEAMGEAKSGGGFARMARLKKMGMRPGVADLVIIKDSRAYFLEMKKPGGKQSENQKAFEIDAMKAGSWYAIAFSFSEAIERLKRWKIIP
jgi:hypothetical protein